MSTVYCAQAVVAGPVNQVERFDQMIACGEARVPSESFTREVLTSNEAGQPTCIRYNASMSRYCPTVWVLPVSKEAAELEMLILAIAFAEQGDGRVAVYLQDATLLSNGNVYGYSNEGQAELCRAQDLFSETARQHFGIEVTLYDKSKVQKYEDYEDADSELEAVPVVPLSSGAYAECVFDPMDDTPF